ncbi:MAG: glycerophosphodiester phosphodiesterase [Dehalococcoidia bacterium]|nr:glycerophosphodiester phosphodiesterase [Dehalococcoidia bacterium]
MTAVPTFSPRYFPPGPGQSAPRLLAHACNSLPALEGALASHPDFVEVDFWARKDALEARHDRALYPIPLLLAGWRLRRAPSVAFKLSHVLHHSRDRAHIFLDFKNGARDAPALVRATLDAVEPDVRVAASSQNWATLRAVRALCPEVDLFYSIDVRAKFDLFLSVQQRDPLPVGVSCNHRLLGREALQQLQARRLLVVAYTVDDLERAAELAAWGVDGLTTHRVADIRQRLAT